MLVDVGDDPCLILRGRGSDSGSVSCQLGPVAAAAWQTLIAAVAEATQSPTPPASTMIQMKTSMILMIVISDNWPLLAP